MAKFLYIWHRNMDAPWPTDPAEGLRSFEQEMENKQRNMQAGLIKDIGYFLNGNGAGYMIIEGTEEDVFKMLAWSSPWFEGEVHELVSEEFWKNTILEMLRMQAAAAAKQK